MSPCFCCYCHGSAKRLSQSVVATSAAAGGGARAAVEKTEGAEQEQTESVFPTCLKHCEPHLEDRVCSFMVALRVKHHGFRSLILSLLSSLLNR